MSQFKTKEEIAAWLDEMGVEGFKTGSGEMTNLPMLRNIARKGKPLIVSTGMARVDEIMETVHALKEEGAGERLILTHCTSAYPPKCEQVNLRFIPRLETDRGSVTLTSGEVRRVRPV